MLPLAILAIAGAVFAALAGLSHQFSELATLYASQEREIRLQAMAQRIQHFHEVRGILPASVGDMATTSGFEDVKGLVDAHQGYVLSAPIKDGSWTFRRAVFYSKSPDVPLADYLADNKCGAGSADDAATVSWCGNKDVSRWYRRETREGYAAQISTQRARLNRSLQKIAATFNARDAFPSSDQAGVALMPGNIYSLPALAGYAGTASACRGPYAMKDGTALDCSDLFDQWGQAVGYQFNSARYVLLISETPISNSAGRAVVIASELDASAI